MGPNWVKVREHVTTSWLLRAPPIAQAVDEHEWAAKFGLGPQLVQRGFLILHADRHAERAGLCNASRQVRPTSVRLRVRDKYERQLCRHPSPISCDMRTEENVADKYVRGCTRDLAPTTVNIYHAFTHERTVRSIQQASKKLGRLK
jgi:hypothetical protein